MVSVSTVDVASWLTVPTLREGDGPLLLRDSVAVRLPVILAELLS